MEAPSSSEPAPPPPRRRQLFKNRPAWSSSATSTKKPSTTLVEDDDDDPLRNFSRSGDTFQLLQEEDARSRREKARKDKQHEKEKKSNIERETSSTRAKESAQEELPSRSEFEEWRLKIDMVIDEDAEDDGLGRSGKDSANPGSSHNTLATPPQSVQSSSTPRSSARKRQAVLVDLDDDGAAQESRPSPKRTRSSRATDNAEDAVVEKKSTQHAITASPSKDSPIILDDDDDDDNTHTIKAPFLSHTLPSPITGAHTSTSTSFSRAPSKSATPAPTPNAPNPVLSLLIHSSLPNTTPLLVKRRLNQRLKEVRLAWINKQSAEGSLSDVDPNAIFLTWRGKRLFDFTTCKSLGASVDDITGEVVVKAGAGTMGREEREWATPGPENAQLVFEAVTEQVVKDRKDGKERALQVAQTTQTQDESGLSSMNAAQQQIQKDEEGAQQEETQNIKIILRAGKDYEDYKLVVRPSTVMSKITGAYRKRHAIPPDKNIFLMFEGEKFGDDDKVGDTDIADEDVVEVRVR